MKAFGEAKLLVLTPRTLARVPREARSGAKDLTIYYFCAQCRCGIRALIAEIVFKFHFNYQLPAMLGCHFTVESLNSLGSWDSCKGTCS